MPPCDCQGSDAVIPTIPPATNMRLLSALPRPEGYREFPIRNDPSQESGRRLRRFLTGTARKARTTTGSNCVPAHLASSMRAASGEHGFLYERVLVMTS